MYGAGPPNERTSLVLRLIDGMKLFTLRTLCSFYANRLIYL